MQSIWNKATAKEKYVPLDGSKTTDVLIIGGGIAGILCAYRLKQAGVDCILAEAKEICSGITENTTAKITFSHGLIYAKTLKRFGREKAKLYLEAQIKAGKTYEALSKTIDCDYGKADSYVYSLSDKQKIEKEIEALHSLGVNAELSEAKELPFPVAGAVRTRNQAHFHPLKFLYSIAQDLPIYEHTKVTELTPHTALTSKGKIHFEKLIIATHFPTLNKHGGYFLKLYQHRSYVLALKGAKPLSEMYVDEADAGLSFRPYGDLLLLGGGSHRTGKKVGCWQELEDFTRKYYKNAEIVSKWATQDCMTLDDIPYIGRYSKSTPEVFVATGFNKWGMTNAMVAADILTDLVQGKSNPYAEVFSPSRSMIHPQLAVNVFESAHHLLTPTAPRCPHLGCALKYNREEHSWDCPCHGSRFSQNGELLNNPATDDHPKIGH